MKFNFYVTFYKDKCKEKIFAQNYSAARLIYTILLYVCVVDTIYGLITKKIAVGNLRKIIVTP
jgi:hypothetical protein